jgi:hypothetical protein
MLKIQSLTAVVFMLTIGTASAAPSSDLIIPLDIQNEGVFRPRSSVSKEAVLRDLDILMSVFKDGYGGWKELGGKFETEVFPKLRKYGLSHASTRDVCMFIGKILDTVPDHHLSVHEFGSEEKCGKTSIKRGSVGPNLDKKKKLAWAYFERRVKGKTVPVVSINRLPPPGDAWKGFLEKIQTLSRTAPALIIDLRGIHGGDDEVTHRMARILFGIEDQSAILAPASTVVQRQTPVALSLFLNTLGLAILKQKFAGKDHSQLDGYYSEYLDLLKKANNGSLPAVEKTEVKSGIFDPKRAFQGPIRILIDSECESGCESAVEFLERHPSAKTVGENTAGLVQFGQIGTLWLKGTNVFVDIATRSYSFADGRFVEKVGYSPSIRVKGGEDALDAAIQDIERKFTQLPTAVLEIKGQSE